MKREALKHPKTYALAAKLGCELPAAIGYLTLLFDFTGSAATQGDVGKWDDSAIARACEWRGEPAQFVQALVESRWLDVCKARRLIVHDWHEHHEEFVRKRLERSGLECFRPVRTKSGRNPDGGRLAGGLVWQGSARLGSLEGGAGETKPELPEFPAALDTTEFRAAWLDWRQHRKDIKKPLTPTSVKQQLRDFEAWGIPRAIAAIRHTILKGWQGLREPDDATASNGGYKKPPRPSVNLNEIDLGE